MCAENVLSDSVILWSSPISAKILSNTKIEDCVEAGILRPLQAIAVKRPTVFNVTVFPPVFGPVITKVLNVVPNSSEIGTAFSWSKSGCFASFKMICFCVFILGVIPWIAFEYLAFAKAKSSFPIHSISSFISFE